MRKTKKFAKNSVMEITQLLSVYKFNKENDVKLFLIPRTN